MAITIMRGAPAAVSFVVLAMAAAVAAQPSITNDGGSLNFNIPVDRDLTVQRSQTISISALADSVRQMQAEVNNMLASSQAYSNAESNIGNILNESHNYAQTHGHIDASLNSIRMLLDATQDNMRADLENLRSEIQSKSTAIRQNMTQMATAVAGRTDAISSSVQEHANCSKRGMAYNEVTRSCVPVDVVILGNDNLTSCNETGAITYDPTAKALRVCNGRAYQGVSPKSDLMPNVAQRGWTSSRSEDSGWVPDRQVNFVKEFDNSYIRVDYYDNFRVHGRGGSYAMWNVYICDASGNNCRECTDPGPLNLHRYADGEHREWDNDHYSGELSGVCRATGSRPISAGRYRLRVLINNRRNDIHTGHHGQYGSFQVTEVQVVRG